MKKLYETDPYLMPYKEAIEARHQRILGMKRHIAGDGLLKDAVNNHMYYGLHRCDDGSWIFREWAPNATKIYLVGDFNNWKRTDAYALKPTGGGNWELSLPAFFLQHGELYKLYIEWPGGAGERLPSYVTRTVQDEATKAFAAQVWDPIEKYVWKHPRAGKRPHPMIYECHIGMSSEQEKVASFEDFRTTVLPKVKKLGYDTLQIMALQEHPYYGSFGYQVSNFFALSSRFGTPEEFKRLVDDAHGKGIAVVMDIVHSHSVDNEAEGLSRFDGTDHLYFYSGPQGRHPAWGSRCFDYGKDETKYFLLSNVKYWMEEYHIDGFRFDGVTSMLYWDHGLGKDFVGYDNYFNQGVDENAVTYLALANVLVKEMDPNAFTIAEDVSGMAGLAAPLAAGGVGFDFRMSMGVADHWIKWIKELSDEQWSVRNLVAAHQQARRREDHLLRRVPRPGPRGGQDAHFQAHGQGDVLLHEHRVPEPRRGPRHRPAQDDPPRDRRHRRRRLPHLHGQRVRPSRMDRLPPGRERLVLQARPPSMVPRGPRLPPLRLPAEFRRGDGPPDPLREGPLGPS